MIPQLGLFGFALVQSFSLVQAALDLSPPNALCAVGQPAATVWLAEALPRARSHMGPYLLSGLAAAETRQPDPARDAWTALLPEPPEGAS